ncbi:IS1249 family transposase [Thermophilibacter immobilis]|uniref:Mutator family transposase n=1 Tax=Thermophilibacter immobilis TaxID=2779519 RepID=A0A7S7M7A2_9ACTN|nr:IS1249 family transposase [Thermophilibacter immobilis]QOY60041.1 IS1249 family transposase [Thermophilibacter immobilis]
MGKVRCPYCGGKTKRSGRTTAGRQRWRCLACGATFVHGIDASAKTLDGFLTWLLSGERQSDLPGGGRTFRRRTSRFWDIWPLPPLVDEVFDVVYVDGIWVARDVVVLIACTDEHVLGWYVARSENSRAWSALLARIAPPGVVVGDGGSGFAKAARRMWPTTRVQRCTFHAFCQVRRYTTSRPKLRAGVEPYDLACRLPHVASSEQAAAWMVSYASWCSRWGAFLAERTRDERGHLAYTHERLVRARGSLTTLVRQGTLFTYVDPGLTGVLGPLPATNNRIEGGVNAQLRRMLRDHRGLSTTRRIKAVYWWCYLHTECPLPAAQILKVMPTDDQIARAYRNITYGQRSEEPMEWGDGLVWQDLHQSVPWRSDWD